MTKGNSVLFRCSPLRYKASCTGRRRRYGSRQFIIFGDLRNGFRALPRFYGSTYRFYMPRTSMFTKAGPREPWRECDERVAFVPAVSYKAWPREKERERERWDAYGWPLKPWIKQCKSVGNNSNGMDERDEDSWPVARIIRNDCDRIEGEGEISIAENWTRASSFETNQRPIVSLYFPQREEWVSAPRNKLLFE